MQLSGQNMRFAACDLRRWDGQNFGGRHDVDFGSLKMMLVLMLMAEVALGDGGVNSDISISYLLGR